MRLGQYERAKAPGLLTEKNLTLERAASLATAIEMAVLETHESNHHRPNVKEKSGLATRDYNMQ